MDYQQKRKKILTRFKVRQRIAINKLKTQYQQEVNRLQSEAPDEDSAESSEIEATPSHISDVSGNEDDIEDCDFDFDTNLIDENRIVLNEYVCGYSNIESMEIINSSNESDENKIQLELSDCLPDMENEIEIEQLQQWALQNKIDHVHFDSLLKILEPKLLPNLTACSKTVLNTAETQNKAIDMKDGNLHTKETFPEQSTSKKRKRFFIPPLEYKMKRSNQKSPSSSPTHASISPLHHFDVNEEVVFAEHTDTQPVALGLRNNTTLKQGAYFSHDQVSAIMTELTSIKTELTSMKTELSSVKMKLRNQTKMLQQNGNSMAQNYMESATDAWTKAFGVELPLKDMTALCKVNNELEAKPELKKVLSSAMIVIMDGEKTLQKNVTAMLRNLISRELAVKFTATKKMTDKIVFATSYSNIYQCILECLSAFLQKSEIKIASAIGTAFTHSKFWEGNRN